MSTGSKESLTLTADDFPAFFAALRDPIDGQPIEPFPWQQRLVRELLTSAHDGGRDGVWPDLLDLPTASGKTATIDIALFVLAIRNDAPRRIVFVVDRRVVVQQAAASAIDIARRLGDAAGDDSVLGEVARRLMAKSAVIDSERDVRREPVLTAELRGGIDIDTEWAYRPDTPTVIVSTVDQVGSRLLMQGYGVSDSMRPVHAGLLANDTLFLLDEVHLSLPFAQTLGAVRRFRRAGRWWGVDRWQFVKLSATPVRNPDESRFALDSADRLSALGRRLSARKPVRLETVKVTGDLTNEGKQVAKALAEQVWQARRASPHARVFAVVSNRVATAALVADLLAVRMIDTEVVLLTGRMRPYDRDLKWDTYRSRLVSGRARFDTDPVLVLVGTQSIEAGADFDVDALVTECASIDALRQRFGRVDRLGELSAAGRENTSVVLITERTKPASDPIYGAALAATAEWLRTLPSVDFGIDQLDLSATDVSNLSTPGKTAPQLMSTQLDLWAQSPGPNAVPEVSQWLHGLATETDPDVFVVWREQLPDRDREAMTELLEASPPLPGEAVAVPLRRARAWLRGQATVPFGDVEGEDNRQTEEPGGERLGWVLWRDQAIVLRSPLRPGDYVVVDATAGGLRHETWDPTSAGPVVDISVPVAYRAGVLVARCDLAAQQLAGNATVSDGDWSRLSPRPSALADSTPGEALATIEEWLKSIPDDLAQTTPQATPTNHGEALRLLASRKIRRGTIVPVAGQSETSTHGGPQTYVIRVRLPQGSRADFTPSASTDIGIRVTLDDHLRDTASWAKGFTEAVGLTGSAASTVIAAARWHDVGKADGRFQLMLREGEFGSLSAASGQPLLAKSAVPYSDRTRRRQARDRAGYPGGERHELFSASMLRESQIDDHEDRDLVVHLVAAHHGAGRPFAPTLGRLGRPLVAAEIDVLGEPFTLRDHEMRPVDSVLARLFWTSIREQGWFSNAWMTSLVRLADHCASRYPTEGPS